MRKTKTRAGFSKLKITWLMLALAGMLAVGSYGWHVYSLFRDWQMNMPQPQLENLTSALPTGPRRQYASSFFIVLAPEWLRSWKGKAIEDDVISRLPAIPKPDQLAALMMQEMPSRVFNQQNERGASR